MAKPAQALLDTGPLVAWLDKSDGDHARVAAFFAGYGGRLLTTWPVLTEVCHLLPRHVSGRFMRWVAAGGTEVAELAPPAADEIAAMMEKYSDLPMDVADASLVWLAGRRGLQQVITLDETDFGIYRLPDGKRLVNLLAQV
jgi:predicted nucleic acid-binding protein